MARSRWRPLAEVEAYVDVSIMFVILMGLCLLALAILVPELIPK